MATIDYIDVPVGATRLRKASEDPNSLANMRPAPKTFTSLPNPSPPSSPLLVKRRPSILESVGGAASSLASPSLNLIPQLLLSSTLPPLSPSLNAPPTANLRKKGDPEPIRLLSSKDPLSLPTMSTNFKRFVSVVGPVFWLQDRVEEILFWKRGWVRTAAWMSAYVAICFFPRLLLMIPHLALITFILSTYPYPSDPSLDPVFSIHDLSDHAIPHPPPPVAPPPAEGSVPWQANIQGIQNLMGAVADAHAILEPYTYHLYLSPGHLVRKRLRTGPGSSFSSHPSSSTRSPYTAHILAILLVSFFPLLFVISLPIFPMRGFCLFMGLLPFFFTHPYIAALLPHLVPLLHDLLPTILIKLKEAQECTVTRIPAFLKPTSSPSALQGDPLPTPISMVLQRFLDDDRLSDICWNSELREVELWENERYGGPASADLCQTPTQTSSSPQKGWSKQNLRQNERPGWTRGRDGCSGVGANDAAGIDGPGEVSSNLTFSLAPGWSFVESEDWRRDLQVAWSGCGGDQDGWVYSNDAWLDPRPSPFTSGTSSLTRRRRWVRRVWFDPKRASDES